MNITARWLVSAALLGLGFAVGAVTPLRAADRSPPAEQPNVILFLVDDMGWIDSSAYGSEYYETPNMERFAKEAMRFTRAYATPLCSPTRASILTGKYSARHGVTSASGHLPPQPQDQSLLPDSGPPGRAWVYPESRNYLQPSEYTLAEALRDAGYRTGHFGKWHLGLTEPHWPEQQGFDVAFHGKPDPGPGSYFSPYRFRRSQTFPDGPAGEYITDRLTEEALRFVEANQDRPFFLNLWHYGVHGPWGHKAEYTQEFANKRDPRGKQGNPIMASMLRSIDESLGAILNQLDKLQLTDKTIVIFMSDNGGNVHSNTPTDGKKANVKPGHPQYAMLQDWRKWAKNLPPTNNAPLRDGKGRLYEGGIRVPLMVRWPGVVRGGKTSDDVVGAIDIYPTVLEMTGGRTKVEHKIDGRSLTKVLRGEGGLERDAYFTWFPHIVPGAAVHAGDWKLIRRYEPSAEYADGVELFNLSDDEGEMKNLAAAKPEKVRELNALLDQFLQETGALVPKKNPAYRGTNATTPTARQRRTAAGSVGGWLPRGCSAKIADGALVVENRAGNAFLGSAGLQLNGPIQLTLRTRGASGAARLQWRTKDQDTFPEEGQVAEFSLRPAAGAVAETRVEIPADGRVVHVRLYLPAGAAPLRIEAIAMQPASGEPRRWEFLNGELEGRK